uniref:Uncharacterized protein n=1 Tax=Anguilla anguilla TaxID=7936 RepID=A0A0E9XLX9_ANGAN
MFFCAAVKRSMFDHDQWTHLLPTVPGNSCMPMCLCPDVLLLQWRPIFHLSHVVCACL